MFNLLRLTHINTPKRKKNIPIPYQCFSNHLYPKAVIGKLAD